VAILRESARPVILAGRGAFEAGARDALVRLADRTGALLATTLRGVGLFDGHRYNAGIAGGFSPPVVADLLGEADCVVAFGAALNRFTMKSGQLFSGAKLVQVDTEPAVFHRFYPVDVAVCGDARELAEAMLARLEGHAASTALRDRADAVSLGPASLRFDLPDVSRPGALDPRAVCRKLDALLPQDRTVVVDTGQLCEYPVESMAFRSPDSLLWMMDFGAVGSGLGPAIGATVGRPERLTVLFVGDGGLFMTLGDLDLAVRDKVPLLVVCMNDRAYGSEMYHMIEMGLPVESAFFETPPLDAVAGALGAEAERVTDLDQLDHLADRLRSLSGPLFLDCILTQDPLPTPLRSHA
jgi:thiamine pyrophosphate-dependent acetolactate synthase large subunit-like protein